MRPVSMAVRLSALTILCCSSQTRAEVQVSAWLLNTESCAECNVAGQSFVVTPDFLSEDAVGNSSETAAALSAYAFHVGDGSAEFEFMFDGWIDQSAQIRSNRSFGHLDFSISPGTDVRYSLGGSYSLSGTSERLKFRVQLLDTTTGASLFLNDQESRSASDETLELGSAGGTFDNVLTGGTTGTLVAGHSYVFSYDVETNSSADVPDACSSTGTLSLRISADSLCGDGVLNDGEACDGGECCEPDCTFTMEGLACGDQNETDCDWPDMCDGVGVCDPNVANDGTPCDDGNVCSTVDACEAGACVGGADETAPTISCGGDLEFDSTGPDGAVVAYDAPTTEDNCGDAEFVCKPASNELFAIGETLVECHATDDAGNDAACSFVVTVLSAVEVVAQLIEDVHVLAETGAIEPRRARSLIWMLEYVHRRLVAGHTRAGCRVLRVLVYRLRAMVNRGVLKPESGRALIESVRNARAALGCGMPDFGHRRKWAPNRRR